MRYLSVAFATLCLIALSLAPVATAHSLFAARDGTVQAGMANPMVGQGAPADEATSRCARQVLPTVASGLTGKVADEAERLQALYEGEAGFLSVVHAGGAYWVVVDEAMLSSWADRLAVERVNVVPSCVHADVAESARAAVAGTVHGMGDFSSVGYSAFTDSLDVFTTED